MIESSVLIKHRWLRTKRSQRCFLLLERMDHVLRACQTLCRHLPTMVSVMVVLVFASLSVQAQLAQVLPQLALKQWNIPPGNYSGITPLGNGHYAVVSDKAPRLGYFEWKIEQDSLTGQVKQVTSLGFRPLQSPATGGLANHDAEDLIFDAQHKLLWIANEGNQTLTAYDTATKQRVGALDIPPYLSSDSVFTNLGFEALAYDVITRQWCSTSESPLRVDAHARPEGLSPTAPLDLRLTFWGSTFSAQRILPYRMAAPQLSRQARYYLHGVPALCFLPNGALLVMERELSVPRAYIGAKCHLRLRCIPADAMQLAERLGSRLISSSVTDSLVFSPSLLHALAPQTQVMDVAQWRTHLDVFRRSFANYEGMCLGRRLADGRQTILCVSDAQDGAGRCGVHLRDFLRVVVLDRECTD